MIKMATAEEINRKFGTLNRRYETDLRLYNNAHAYTLFLQNGWEPVPGSFWSIKGVKSGIIREKKIDSDYCIEIESTFAVARNGPYGGTVSIDDLPAEVIDKIAEALDNIEAIMERVDDKFLMEADTNG